MIAVIACGNAVRRDDGAGHAVLQRLQADISISRRQDIRFIDAATDGLAVMFGSRGASQLILVDACRSGQPPGSVFEVPGEEFICDSEPPRDSHALRWDHALTMGMHIWKDQMPETISVFLIEAADTGFGLELSPEVARAVDSLAQRLARQLQSAAA